MTVQLTFDVRPDYLHAEARGSSDVESIEQGLRDVKARAEQSGRTRILIDARATVGPRFGLDRFVLGKYAAELFGPRYRIAILYAEQVIDKFGENTAVNRGANMLVTSDEARALEWLLEEES